MFPLLSRQSRLPLVDALRNQACPLVSLVAEDAGAIVGHIMFSPMSLPDHPALKIMGLAPMAVAPQHQRKGIGSALIRNGLKQCRQLGFGAVVVLGHPRYYPRFGFLLAARFGIRCGYDAPEEAFMIVELQAGFFGWYLRENQISSCFQGSIALCLAASAVALYYG